MPEIALADTLAALLALSLNGYVLFGGADFGGGVWDMLATGPRRARQREVIAHAIGPIWEANHVWLILAIVLAFTCFAPVFARIMTVLHIPVSLMLVGIVLRGSAFTFRTYDEEHDAAQLRWGRIFSSASVVTPLLLGVCIGAVASGRVVAPAEGSFAERFVEPWLTPFAFGVGVLTLALFAFLAAVFLTMETRDRELVEDFRRRALGAGVAVFLASALVLLLSFRRRAGDHPEAHTLDAGPRGAGAGAVVDLSLSSVQEGAGGRGGGGALSDSPQEFFLEAVSMTDTHVSTPRLDLTPLGADAIDALLAGDGIRLQALTGARFRQAAPPPYMADALPVVRDRLRARPSEAPWWNWLLVDRESGEAVGSVAFGGPVNQDGAVLVGYAMYAGCEGRGYATEAVRALVAWAFSQPGVREVRALAPVWNTPALRVAENVGIRPVAADEDDDVGEVLLYAVTAPAFVGSA